MIEVNIPLFGMASLEMDIAGREIVESDLFLLKGLELLERLGRVTEIVTAMRNDGWLVYGEIFNLSAYHQDIATKEEIKERLMQLHIEPSEVFVTECDEYCEDYDH